MYSARIFGDSGGAYALGVVLAMNEVIKFSKSNPSKKIVLKYAHTSAVGRLVFPGAAYHSLYKESPTYKVSDHQG